MRLSELQDLMDEFHVPNFVATSRKQVIDQNGRLYPSITAAAKAIKAHQSSVSQMLRGKRKSVKGFVFSYCPKL